MQTRRTDPTSPRERDRLHEYRGRESYEEQSPTGRGGRSGAFPQRDYPPYAERHPQPFDTRRDDYLDDDYSRTDYGPWHPHGRVDREREARKRDELRFVNGGYAPVAQPRSPRGYKRTDERVREEVCEQLGHAPDLDVSDVEVEVQGGEVTLRGSIPDRAQKHRAENLAAAVPGVQDVHNSLRLRWAPPRSP